MNTSVVVSVVLMPLLAASARSNQQPPSMDIPAAARQLAGDNSRTWVLDSIKVVLGGAGGCTAGETWRFLPDHQVEIRVCRDKHLVTETLKWSLSKEGDLDTVVTVGTVRYYVVFERESSATVMRLRNVATTKRAARTTKEFRLQEAE